MSGNAVPIVMFIMSGATVVLFPIARALARRMERASENELPGHMTQRLERMEQSIDVIAEQVERIAEGQRFTTKLLSERGTARTSELPGA